jgi:hypothetical protein
MPCSEKAFAAFLQVVQFSLSEGAILIVKQNFWLNKEAQYLFTKSAI